MGFNYDPGKWSLSQTVVLKKIGKPVAMYAKSVNLGMPAFDKPVGYDLEIGDWVGVYGKGVNADILFTGYFKDKTNNKSDYTLTVTFPNPADGLQEFTTTEFAQEGPYSELRSSHEAPLEGYQSEWVQSNNRTLGKAEMRITIIISGCEQKWMIEAISSAHITESFMAISCSLSITSTQRSMIVTLNLIRNRT